MYIFKKAGSTHLIECSIIGSSHQNCMDRSLFVHNNVLEKHDKKILTLFYNTFIEKPHCYEIKIAKADQFRLPQICHSNDTYIVMNEPISYYNFRLSLGDVWEADKNEYFEINKDYTDRNRHRNFIIEEY